MPKAAIPAARVSSRAISLPWRVANAPVSAVSAVATPALAPAGPYPALPALGAAEVVGTGVTTGNRLARLPAGLGADRPRPVPRGNCVGRASGPATSGDRMRSPLTAGLLGEGTGERDRLGEGDALGELDLLGEGEGLGDRDLVGDGDGDGDLLGDGDGDLLGDGDGLGEGDLLGEGEGLGDGDLLGEGDALDLPGEGDGEAIAARTVAAADPGASAGLAAALALPAIAMRTPAAVAPPQARTCAPARALPRIRPR